MMGLEPTTFCMAKAGGRLRTFARFAETCRLRGLRASRANASEPERTPSAAIAAIVIAEEGALRERLPLLVPVLRGWLLRPPEPSAPDQDCAAERGKDEAKRGPGAHAGVCPLKATGGDDLDDGASCVAGLGAEDARVVPSSIFLPDDALDRRELTDWDRRGREMVLVVSRLPSRCPRGRGERYRCDRRGDVQRLDEPAHVHLHSFRSGRPLRPVAATMAPACQLFAIHAPSMRQSSLL
jgi:hypothetical protein